MAGAGPIFTERELMTMIHLGEKIRLLRKQAGISQEVLAQAMGVSFQAVSKWENGTALPDVAAIPSIAAFFGVSTDELFDFNRLESEQKVMEICQSAWACRDEHPAEAERILRDGLRQYPGNDILLNNLLYTMRAPERNDEVVTLCKALAESTRDRAVKYDALRILAETYRDMGEDRLMRATLAQLPEIYFTKLQLDAELLPGDEMVAPAQRQKEVSAGHLVEMLCLLAEHYRAAGEPEKAAVQQRVASNVILALRDDLCPPFLHTSLHQGRCAALAGLENNLQ